MFQLSWQIDGHSYLSYLSLKTKVQQDVSVLSYATNRATNRAKQTHRRTDGQTNDIWQSDSNNLFSKETWYKYSFVEQLQRNIIKNYLNFVLKPSRPNIISSKFPLEYSPPWHIFWIRKRLLETNFKMCFELWRLQNFSWRHISILMRFSFDSFREKKVCKKSIIQLRCCSY